MSRLFESTTIKSMQLDNRFVRSATNMSMAAEDGTCTPKLIDALVNLAEGGVGLIITGHAYVQEAGRASGTQIGCRDDSMLSGLTDLAQAVHQVGGAIALQLAHGGILAPAEQIGEGPRGPSGLQTAEGTLGRAMTMGEIEGTVEAFAVAASRAVQAGFDAVQIHSAHGYLLSEFLSPYFNHRTDEYGGSLENRSRMLLQVVRAVRGAVGNGYPVLVKMNSEDLLDGGLSKEEALEVAAMLQQAGVDAIEFSGGTTYAFTLGEPERSWAPTKKPPVYYREAAEQYQARIDVPLILVGGIRSFETAEELVDSGVADYISMSRPFIREPDLVNRWKAGDRRKADCISDDLCGFAASRMGGLRCMHLEQ